MGVIFLRRENIPGDETRISYGVWLEPGTKYNFRSPRAALDQYNTLSVQGHIPSQSADQEAILNLIQADAAIEPLIRRDATWRHYVFTGQNDNEAFLDILMHRPDVIEALLSIGATIGEPEDGGAWVAIPAGVGYWADPADETSIEIVINSQLVLVTTDQGYYLAAPNM